MTTLPYHATGRFYDRMKADDWVSRRLWAGGPIAFLVRASTAPRLLARYQKHLAERREANDIILSRMLDGRSFVCREPQLGYEHACGSSELQAVVDADAELLEWQRVLSGGSVRHERVAASEPESGSLRREVEDEDT